MKIFKKARNRIWSIVIAVRALHIIYLLSSRYNFVVDDYTTKTIIWLAILSPLSNKQIASEILEMHTIR